MKYRVGWSKFDKGSSIPFHLQATALTYCTGFISYHEALEFSTVLAQRDDFLRCVIEVDKNE